MKLCMKYKNQAGFTLIELIATMVIMGMIGLGASIFLVYGVQGFILAQTNNEVYQKANIAMERLSREMKHLDAIVQFSSSSILFKRGGQDFGIALVGSTIQVLQGNSLPGINRPGSPLIDDITGFVMIFENVDGSAWVIPADNSITGLSKITIQMDVNTGTGSRSFSVDINPLYNNMVNGPTT